MNILRRSPLLLKTVLKTPCGPLLQTTLTIAMMLGLEAEAKIFGFKVSLPLLPVKLPSVLRVARRAIRTRSIAH